MKQLSDFFGEVTEANPIDLGACRFCGNHELQHTASGTPFLRSRRDCCLPQALHRANILLATIIEAKVDQSEIVACNEDLRILAADIQRMLKPVADKKTVLLSAQERLKDTQYQADALPRLLRSIGHG